VGEWESGRVGEWESGRVGEWENRRTADGDFFASLDGFEGADADLVGFGHEASVRADRVRTFELRENGAARLTLACRHG